jgi:excisionase family DNA binding protein
MTVEQAVDVAGLATILGVSRQTIYRLAAAGEIPKIKIGRAIRFLPSEVLAVLSAQTAAATTPPEDQPDVDPWAQSAASRRRKRAA